MKGLAGSALAGAAALLAVPGAAASTASTASAAALPRLAITGLTQLVADDVHSHLYMTGNGSLTVTNLAGGTPKTLYNTGQQPGAMALSGDGNTLYVLLSGVSEVAAISARTLAQTGLYKLPAGDAAAGLTFQSGRIWVSYSSATLTGAVGYFKPGSAAFTPNALPTTVAWPAPPRLASDPNPDTEGTLVAVDGEGAPAMIATYNVAGAAPVKLQENDAFAACTGFSDLAVSAGGARFVLACTGAATDLGFSSATLAPVVTADYASGAAPDAVAISPDNTGVAAGTSDAATARLATFKTNGAAVNAYPLTAAGEIVAPRGLAWSADATKLYAVLKGGARYYLDVIQYAQYKPSSLDLTSPSLYWQAGAKVVLRGKLELGGAPAPAGVTVKIFRQVVGSSAITTLFTRTVAGGAFTLTNVPPRYAHYFYTAYYPTTGTYAPNWHSCLVIVNPLHTTLRLTAPRSAPRGTTVRVTARLGKTYSNRYVSIYAQPARGAKKLVKRARVNSQGILAISYKLTANTTFTAVFAGDAHYAPATAKATVAA